jgi:hypothetical protein
MPAMEKHHSSTHLAAIGIVLAALLAASCATVPTTSTGTGLVPGPDTALINLYRPSTLGNNTGFFVCVDDKLVAVTQGKSLHQILVPAGKINLMLKSQNWEVMSGEVAAGKTYHILTSISMGVTRGVARWEVVEPNDPRILETKLKPVTQTRNQVKRFSPKLDKMAEAMLEKIRTGGAKVRPITPDMGY